MDTIYKILENCEVKKVGERQYEFTASTADMDRDGEVIDVSGWDLKNFKKNPVIMYAHAYNTLPIGKATKIGVRDGKLVDVVEFPPEGTYEFADIVQRLVDAGYLKTQSVGFIPKKWEDAEFEDDEKGQKPRRTYTKQELLEISIVPVPSNPNALMNAVKEGVITQKQFKSITEPEEKSVSYNDELKRNQLNDAFFAMLDTLVSCYFKTIRDKQDEDKTKTMKSHAKSFNSSFSNWIEEAGEAGLFNQSESNDLDMIFFSFTNYLSKFRKQKDKSPHDNSQESIIDELDYLDSMLKENGANDKVKEILQRVAESYAIQDATIPVEDNKESLKLLGEIIKEQFGGK